MTLSPHAHVTTAPTLAEVMEAAKNGAGLIGRLEVVVPVNEAPAVAAPVEIVVAAPVVEVATPAFAAAPVLPVVAVAPAVPVEPAPEAPAAPIEVPFPAAEHLTDSGDVATKLLAAIAELEHCVVRATDEAERAAQRLAEVRAWAAEVIATAKSSKHAPVTRLAAVPGQRVEERSNRTARRGRW
ncbi:MAG: hypothetical protein JWQ74_1767 [Marmoricola sp.]|nr:hypothetical protein [Marmoricola sp.]